MATSARLPALTAVPEGRPVNRAGYIAGYSATGEARTKYVFSQT